MVNVLRFTASLCVKHFQLAYNIVFRKIIKFVIKKDTIFIVNLEIRSENIINIILRAIKLEIYIYVCIL